MSTRDILLGPQKVGGTPEIFSPLFKQILDRSLSEALATKNSSAFRMSWKKYNPADLRVFDTLLLDFLKENYGVVPAITDDLRYKFWEAWRESSGNINLTPYLFYSQEKKESDDLEFLRNVLPSFLNAAAAKNGRIWEFFKELKAEELEDIYISDVRFSYQPFYKEKFIYEELADLIISGEIPGASGLKDILRGFECTAAGLETIRTELIAKLKYSASCYDSRLEQDYGALSPEIVVEDYINTIKDNYVSLLNDNGIGDTEAFRKEWGEDSRATILKYLLPFAEDKKAFINVLDDINVERLVFTQLWSSVLIVVSAYLRANISGGKDYSPCQKPLADFLRSAAKYSNPQRLATPI